MQINPIGIGINGIGAEGASGAASRKQSVSFPRPPETAETFKTDQPAVEALVAQAMQASPVRFHKVQELKAAVNLGEYSIDPREIASAMAKELAP